MGIASLVLGEGPLCRVVWTGKYWRMLWIRGCLRFCVIWQYISVVDCLAQTVLISTGSCILSSIVSHMSSRWSWMDRYVDGSV